MHYVEDPVDNTTGIIGGFSGAYKGMLQAQSPWKKIQLPAVLPVVLNDIENIWFSMLRKEASEVARRARRAAEELDCRSVSVSGSFSSSSADVRGTVRRPVSLTYRPLKLFYVLMRNLQFDELWAVRAH